MEGPKRCHNRNRNQLHKENHKKLDLAQDEIKKISKWLERKERLIPLQRIIITWGTIHKICKNRKKQRKNPQQTDTNTANAYKHIAANEITWQQIPANEKQNMIKIIKNCIQHNRCREKQKQLKTLWWELMDEQYKTWHNRRVRIQTQELARTLETGGYEDTWRYVQMLKKGHQSQKYKDLAINDKDGNKLTTKEQIWKRWMEYAQNTYQENMKTPTTNTTQLIRKITINKPKYNTKTTNNR